MTAAATGAPGTISQAPPLTGSPWQLPARSWSVASSHPSTSVCGSLAACVSFLAETPSNPATGRAPATQASFGGQGLFHSQLIGGTGSPRCLRWQLHLPSLRQGSSMLLYGLTECQWPEKLLGNERKQMPSATIKTTIDFSGGWRVGEAIGRPRGSAPLEKTALSLN